MPAQRDLPADDAALYFTLFPAQACENGRAGREAPRARSAPEFGRGDGRTLHLPV